MKLTHGELFAGISGFGLGFSEAGIETAWQVEIDKHCRSVLKRHYPDVLLLEDVRECGKRNLPNVDVVSFGSPCQDLSTLGKRGGLDGKRSSLFYEAIRVVAELQPAFAVWENVVGALSSNDGRDFVSVLDAFRERGARDVAWRTLDALYFGVPQRRRRIFLVADFGGERAAEVLFETEPCGEHGEVDGERQRTNTIVARYGRNGWGSGRPVVLEGDVGWIEARLCEESEARTRSLNSALEESFWISDFGGTGFTMENSTSTSPSRREESRCSTIPAFGTGARNIADSRRPTGNFGRRKSGEIASGTPSPRGNSNRGDGKSSEFGDVRLRVLTPRECERLQGFPDDWTSLDEKGVEIADGARYRMLGNAVCSKVTVWIGKRIVKVLENGD